jgi:hypothetical protein
MTLKGVQFVSDMEGKRTAVLIDLKRCGPIWEDFYDVLIAEERKDELRVPWEDVKKRLRARRARRG